MTINDLTELHNITHLKNLPSILEHGILSNERAKKLKHESVAMQEIQDRRADVVLPNNRKLHSYANVYIYARNKMMSKIRGRHRDLCVLRIDKRILQDATAIVADQNASSKYVRFSAGIAGLGRINKDIVLADSWLHPEDQIAEWRHGSAMCAEVLVLNRIPPEFIVGVYVSCEESANDIRKNHKGFDVTVNGKLFFLVESASW
jgi:hypothetical protein